MGTSKIINSESSAPASTRSLSNVLTYSQYATGPLWSSHGYWPQPDQGDDYPYVQTSYGLLSSGQDTGCGNPNGCPIVGGNAIFADFPGSSSAYPPGRPRAYFGHTYSCNTTSDSLYAPCFVPTGSDWSPLTSYTTTPATSIITPRSGNAGDYSFEVTEATAGSTSCSSAPVWPQTVSGTVTDCGVTWENIGVAGAKVGDYGFGCQYSIMSVSQDGNWAMIASGMLLSLGIDSTGHGRCDAFIVHLK